MNKAIAEIFSNFISLVHIVAIGGFCWYLIHEKPWQQGQTALIFTVLVFFGYVAVTGLLSTFIAMNENILELKEEIKSLNDDFKIEVVAQLEEISSESATITSQLQAISSESATITSSVESVASDTSEITSLINLEAGSLNEAIQTLSDSAKHLGQSVTTLNQLLNQDWFKKLILK